MEKMDYVNKNFMIIFKMKGIIVLNNDPQIIYRISPLLSITFAYHAAESFGIRSQVR